MPSNNEENDFFSGFDNVNRVAKSANNQNVDFFAGFDDDHGKSKSANQNEQQTTPALPASSDESKLQNPESEKKSSSSLIAFACICLLCVGGFAYKVMNDSDVPHPTNATVQEKKQEKNTEVAPLSPVSYKQFKNDRTGVVFEYPSTCSFDTVGSEECRLRLNGVAEISVGKNTESVIWDKDIEHNMRRIEGERIKAEETISNMQKISDNSCLWQGKTKLGCLYITKSYFMTSPSDGKTNRYDMTVYFPQVGYALDSDSKTKEIVQYMLGSYRVDALPTSQAKEKNEPSKASSVLSPAESTKQKTQREYKTFQNDTVGYSFSYPAGVVIEKPNEIGIKINLTRIVKINININNTNVWSHDMGKNIAAIKDDARIYRDSIKEIKTLSDNSLIVYGTDKFGMNYIEKAYFITNPSDGTVARYDMTIYCDWQGYKLESEPQVNEIVQYMLNSYKF